MISSQLNNQKHGCWDCFYTLRGGVSMPVRWLQRFGEYSPIFPNIPSRIPRFMAGQGYDKSFINGYCCTERIVVQIHTVWPSLDSLKIIFPITVNILQYSPKFQICLGHAFLEWQLHRKSLQMPSSDISRGLQKKLWGPKHGLWVPFRQYSPGGNI